MEDNVHAGHRDRVREEFRQMGLAHYPAHKMLELLLFYAIPRRDTNPIGHRLEERFGSLSGVFDAPYELLLEVEGVTENAATLIKLVSALIREYMDDYTSQHNSITDSGAAQEYMRYKFLTQQVECVYLACLGNNGKIIYGDWISKGSPVSVSLAPGEILKTALRANAVKVVLGHNHPNGLCLPSKRDLGATRVLFQDLMRMDVELLDHIIVAQDGVYSMRDHGFFDEIAAGLLG